MNIISIINPGSGEEQYKKIQLTDAEIKLLFTTGLVFLPAPGAGKTIAISPKSQVYFKSTTAYATNTTLQLAFSSGGGVAASNASILLTSATTAIQKLIPASERTLEENSALEVNIPTGNAIGGNAANVFIVELYYDVIKVPHL